MKNGVVFMDVDTQKDFMDPKGALYVPGAVSLVKILKSITSLADGYRIPIVSSLDWHAPRDPEFKMFRPHCVRNTAGARKISATVAVKTKQIFIRKKTYDVFSNPAAFEALAGFSDVYVYGVALDYCVKADCLGALKLGLNVYLIKDATKAISPVTGKEALRLLRTSGVHIITSRSLKRRIGL